VFWFRRDEPEAMFRLYSSAACRTLRSSAASRCCSISLLTSGESDSQSASSSYTARLTGEVTESVEERGERGGLLLETAGSWCSKRLKASPNFDCKRVFALFAPCEIDGIEARLTC